MLKFVQRSVNDIHLQTDVKDNRGLLQKLLSFRYQKPNQILIEGTVSNPEFEPNQISEYLNQSRMRTGQASILVKVIKMSKYWRKRQRIMFIYSWDLYDTEYSL